jgi:hypothetical protein
VEIFDKDHKSIRKEHYSGDEIWAHWDDLFGSSRAGPTTSPTTGPAATSQPTTEPTEAELRSAWQEARYRQIMAATQPAR